MISLVSIPSDYSSSLYALVAFSSSSSTVLNSGLPQDLEVLQPVLGDRADFWVSDSVSNSASHLTAPPSSNSELEVQAQTTQSPLTSVPSPSLQFVKAISSWSSGISESLNFDAPLVAVVENPNPRSLTPPPEANDTKELSSVKGGGTSTEQPEHEQRDCLAADEMLPKPAFNRVFQVQVKGQTIANLPTQAQADALAQSLEQALNNPDFSPETLQATIDRLTPIGKAGEIILFQIDPELISQFDRNPELLAISWVNNLRSALEVLPVPIAEAQSQMHTLSLTQKQLKGNASWYDPSFAGSLTATGETFDPVKLTAAHPTLPFDTYLKVTNQETQDSVVVRINDRGPYLEDRSLDLSGEAARCLNSEASGVVPYEAVVMENPQAPQTQEAQPTAPSIAPSSAEVPRTN
ncbi:MAG: septal ring lytic transglycosylase RlpA family protein [Drouetiella hepatica Uher 2000/2452]|jgi:hypothetical protein|uniref:Probable endolytic peptidoglycan transglycosylase RlpA n=1 Tax=Drouetiella hepatica Uher 2000/2452 TaxID=904376 RepID=A0A951Q8V7_9CYAN|nr:septal ring lytic transglycosylase RlpA family protein [Drouetiella hepatica Uher 2000/2452]